MHLSEPPASTSYVETVDEISAQEEKLHSSSDDEKGELVTNRMNYAIIHLVHLICVFVYIHMHVYNYTCTFTGTI